MSQSQENVRTEGRKDGQTLIHGTLPATAGGPKRLNYQYNQLILIILII